ncbi:cytoplasmic tRNA 2-thiolation protein 2-A [Bicyclus anynana]|uniref:Cytoplasmic tRNA 2-thiolation protein 2 n=1 Tax=Bicyclus anynana TaxID=110368 RepID=A0A6J1MUW6_BICAN|nr:cytoplasmic tRNA 2-thiolation protein 2-A [Bicyclus anynana]
MICRKCDAPATILIRKEYWYCNTCFITNTNHKFRACLGRSKTLSPNEKVLICLSDSTSSMVLLDLVQNSISLNGTKKLRVIPFFLHIIETATEDSIRTAKLIIEQCNKYNLDIYIVDINEYYSTNNILPDINVLPQTKSETLNNMRMNVSATIYDDVIVKIKRTLFLRIASELSCKIIFTAETTTQLAKRLLTNLAIGRGSQVENDIGFADQRDKSIKILRPMKDISNEEIEYFLKVKQISKIQNSSNTKIGLQSVVDNFVLDLQKNYPATVSTVCKTADKLGSAENTTETQNCTLCQSNITFKSSKLTAVEATIFSRQMCTNKAGVNDKIEVMQSITEDKNPMFPSIYKTLCYGCSRNFSELDSYL